MRNLLIGHFLLSSIQFAGGALIPWILINKMGAGELYLWVYYIIVSFSIIWGIIAGYLVDRFPQKKIFIIVVLLNIINSIVSLIITSINFMVGLFIHFIMGFIIGPLQYNNLYAYGAIFSEGKKMSGWIEFQVQVGAIVGALFSLIFTKIINEDYYSIVIGYYVASALISFIVLWMFMGLEDVKHSRAGKEIFTEIVLTALWFASKTFLFIFSLISLLPFCVLLLWEQYMLPRFVEEVLTLPTRSLSFIFYYLGLISYSCGAILGGFLFNSHSVIRNVFLIIVHYFIFILGLILIIIGPSPYILLLTTYLFGIGNAGLRVCRVNLLWALIPYKRLGRINSILSIFSTIFRTLLTGSINTSLFMEEKSVRNVLVLFMVALLLPYPLALFIGRKIIKKYSILKGAAL